MPTDHDSMKEGKYKCQNCGKVITVDSISNTGPTCPNCNSTKFSWLGSERH